MSYVVEINGWKVNIRFSSAHLLPSHRKCDVLHGHSYAIHCRVYGEKDEEGLVMDFSVLKSALKEIADKLDHRVLIPGENKCVTEDEREIIINVDDKRYVFPRGDCVLLPIKNATAEDLAEYILTQLLKRIDLPENVEKIEIRVDEGLGQGAFVERTLG
jgi:6-pyruvoyltetrahydropterin/6-carboxytetrahydropterin synthase